MKSANRNKPRHFMHFLVVPLKAVGCWDWYKHPKNDTELMINNIYLGGILFLSLNLPIALTVHMYLEWTDVMSSLGLLADGLPLLTSIFIISYFATYKNDLYGLAEFMDNNFKWRSSYGLTNMTMTKSFEMAKSFTFLYTACTLFSVLAYVFLPVITHLVMKTPLQPWIYEDVSETFFLVLIFLRQCLVQVVVGLAMGQLGTFFATNSILLCGQLDLLCCSLRNLRYTALLQNGVQHKALVAQFGDIQNDEKHNYIYNIAEMTRSSYHYDVKVRSHGTMSQFDIYDRELDTATCEAIKSCAKVFQNINEYKKRFEDFVSPLLVIRVVQVTLYLCMLLYTATLKFDMVTVEYLGAVALDIFVYCYFGNQIILQGDRVSVAAYQSAWPSMGVRPRRLLLNMLLSNRRPIVVRAGHFLPIDLQTFVLIIKTSFSYYTLLVSVNEQ